MLPLDALIDRYWFPTLMIGFIWLVVNIAVVWFVIFTAVRAALRSVRDDEHEMRSGRYGLPPRL